MCEGEDSGFDIGVGRIVGFFSALLFGMAMRVGGESSYRFGFNGKENDNEVKGGEGLQQDYGMRIYDNRLGRFLSVDPLTKAYAFYTPYQFSGNKPIAYVDLDGVEEKLATYYYSKDEDGREHIEYGYITLEAHQQDKRFGNKGTLTKYYIQNPATGKTDYYEAYEYHKEVPKDGFWNQLFGALTYIPQIQIFGSGYSRFGNPANPDLPIETFDLSGDELFELLLLGREGPEKFGPLSDVDKWEEAAKFFQKMREANTANTAKEKLSIKKPVIVEETKEGEWDYYIRKDGALRRSEYKSQDPDVLKKGENGAPDTIKKVKYSQPKAPKVDIPENK